MELSSISMLDTVWSLLLARIFGLKRLNHNTLVLPSGFWIMPNTMSNTRSVVFVPLCFHLPI